MKTHVRVRRATSKTPGSVVKARVFFPTPRSAHFVIYVVDKGILTTPKIGGVPHHALERCIPQMAQQQQQQQQQLAQARVRAMFAIARAFDIVARASFVVARAI